MSMRTSSGKFTIPFGRKSDAKGPSSPTTGGPSHGRFFSGSGGGGGGSGDDDFSPGGATGGTGSGGLNLGKRIAHQSLIPGLGNQDLRQLQDVISTEKSVLSATERMSSDTAKAATALPAFGSAEGPDLQDILTQSSALLNHLSSALSVFAGHQAQMRVSYKRIREREETLDELRRRRRSTGAKAESAEKKLAKMGPENKGLPGQTDLLERLRQDMRSMDTEIVMEESKLGDFKRQMLKEALSLKFGGLEELGEKMCIIGELGKLLLEEIPLEETPPGYGRAPYNGYEKTVNAVNEAARCLSGVQFHASNSQPKPPGLPHHKETAPLTTPSLQHDRVTAAEDFANYPGNVASPEAKGKNRETAYGLDENPYGGYVVDHDRYRDYGGRREDSYNSATGGNQVVWQGPTEEALRAHAQREDDKRQQYTSEAGHGYEYEQQKQMDAEAAAWRDAPPQGQGEGSNGGSRVAQVNGADDGGDLPHPHDRGAPWEPLSIKRGQTPTTDANGATTPIPHFPTPPANAEHQLGEPLEIPPASQSTPPAEDYAAQQQDTQGGDELAPPNAAFMGDNPRARTPQEGFYTPMTDMGGFNPIDQLEQLEKMEKDYSITEDSAGDAPPPPPPPPPPPAVPAPVITSVSTGRESPVPMTPSSPATYGSSRAGGGKISAAAFRRGAKPRMSGDDEEGKSFTRRLPVPPLNPTDGRATPTSSVGTARPTVDQSTAEEQVGQTTVDGDGDRQTEEGHGAFSDVRHEADPPPVYAGESLR